MNKTSAQEWLKKAWHNLSGAKLFYDANHYTDVTGTHRYCFWDKAYTRRIKFDIRYNAKNLVIE